MDAIGSRTAAGDTGTQPVGPPRRRWGRIALLILCLAVASFGGGFFWFVHLVQVGEAAPARNADGIVALTGGPFRINDALDLLAAGRGKRLLISGVNPLTRPGEISRLMPEHQRWFTCCVDIEHSATNTIGNAIETRRWVKARGFQSLIVVTANFHIPRFVRIAQLIEEHGMAAMREPYIKHLEGKLWEMRMRGKDGIARAIYVTAKGERVVVVHAFVKKTQKTPQTALETARKRAKEVT